MQYSNRHADCSTYLVGGPDSGPGKHGHASLLDLGFLEELGVGEHVGEGIKGLSQSKLVQAQGIPDLRRLRGSLRRLEEGGRDSSPLRGERIDRGNRGEGSNENGLHGGCREIEMGFFVA